MTTSSHVVAFDFSQSSRAALQRAVMLADRTPPHVLHVVCAIDPHAGVAALLRHGPVDYIYSEYVQDQVTEAIGQELRTAEVADRVHFCVHARIGKPAEEILTLAREVGADLILVGNKSRGGIERLLLGSVSERVVREAGCTVEVVRSKTYEDVALLDVIEVTPSHHYAPPHRYTYDQRTAMMRPDEWPIY